MKKKILSIALVVCLLATALVSGTLAYFTDSDKDVNVMTTGNITIVQNETDRNGVAWNVKESLNGENPKLVPAVYYNQDKDGNYTIPYTPDKESTEGPGYNQFKDDMEKWYPGEYEIGGHEGVCYGENIENEIDKFITVSNKGTEDAYVRTIVLYEDNEDELAFNKLHFAYTNGFTFETDLGLVKIGEETYSVATYTYDTALASGETSIPSLMQIWLNPNVGNEWKTAFGNEYKIIAFSQACQTTGFTSASQALDTAFGEINAKNIVKWVEETGIKTEGNRNEVGGSYL